MLKSLVSGSDEKGKTIMSTSWGAPIDDDNNSLTVGMYGPVLLQDFHLIDKIGHFDFERIPERVVHAKGAGAHGYFEVTHDVTKFTKARFLSKVGKRTPVFMRFSPVNPERGGPDTARDPRGFAIKHYTEEGNYDMVGNNTPIFFIRDAIQFPDFVHSQKRNPQSFLKDANAYWDFAIQVPESIHQFMFNFSDRGIPATYRHMNGYSSNTYKWVNAAGEGFWVKLHYKTEAGIKNLSAEAAAETQGLDPDHATRDLFNHLKAGKTAAWRAFVQVMPEEDWSKYKWNIFDVTKVWPHKDYPLIPYGRLVLDRNPTNYFAETEQVAFCVSHFVPGIEPSPDRVLQGRLFSYADTNRARLGPNFMQIPINCPYKSIYKGGAPDVGATGAVGTHDTSATEMRHYHDACQNNNLNDGLVVVNDNGGNRPNYNPSSDPMVPRADKKIRPQTYSPASSVWQNSSTK